jgi:hypothetical protein
MLSSVAVKNIVPSAVENYPEKKKEQFFEKIKKFKEEILANKNYKPRYGDMIDEVRDWSLFGCVYFNVKLLLEDKKAEAALPKGLNMGVSSQGVFLVFGKDKKIHESLPFYRILKFEQPDPESLVVCERLPPFFFLFPARGCEIYLMGRVHVPSPLPLHSSSHALPVYWVLCSYLHEINASKQRC